MSEVLEDLPPSTSEEIVRGYGLIDRAREREFRLGEIFSGLQSSLLKLPDDTDSEVDDKNMMILKHEPDVVSVQYQVSHRYVNGVRIYLNRAISVFRGPNGILYGEAHYYFDVWRDPDVPVQKKELPETVEPLNSDDMAILIDFNDAANGAIEKQREIS